MATRLCGKVFTFVKRSLSGAQRRKDTASGQRGTGERRQALPRLSTQRPGARRALSLTSVREPSVRDRLGEALLKLRCEDEHGTKSFACDGGSVRVRPA